jgi:hypothetical protein
MDGAFSSPTRERGIARCSTDACVRSLAGWALNLTRSLADASGYEEKAKSQNNATSKRVSEDESRSASTLTRFLHDET